MGGTKTDTPSNRMDNQRGDHHRDTLLDINPLKHTTMKASDNFTEAIRQYLDDRAQADNLFAVQYASPDKSVEECCQYILNAVQRQGVNVMSNADVYSLALHYWDGDVTKEEIGNPIQCRVVITKDQLSDEDKAEIREEARKRYQEEQMREIRNRNAQKASKPQATKQPQVTESSLFDF